MGKRTTRSSRQEQSRLEENEYYVEKIVSRKLFGDKFLYEVKWEGYPESENTWIAEEDFTDIKFVREFDKKCDEKGRRRRSTSCKKRSSSTTKTSNEKRKECDIGVLESHSDITKVESVVSSLSASFDQSIETPLYLDKDSTSENINDNISNLVIEGKSRFFLDDALDSGLKVGRLMSSDVKFVLSKFCGFDEVKYLLELVTGDILLVGLDQLSVDRNLRKRLKEADYRHEQARKLFFS
uniref:Chromo domain-containing protein n=1 Tax=Strongyloides stercoralis TaxID=6248 RepID=A0A0K0DWX9_STRER